MPPKATPKARMEMHQKNITQEVEVTSVTQAGFTVVHLVDKLVQSPSRIIVFQCSFFQSLRDLIVVIDILLRLSDEFVEHIVHRGIAWVSMMAVGVTMMWRIHNAIMRMNTVVWILPSKYVGVEAWVRLRQWRA